MHTACQSKDMTVMKYLIEERGMSLNNTRKAKPPIDFLFPEKEFEESIFKKWKPVYEIQIPKNALDFLNGRSQDFDKKEPGELVSIRFNDTENSHPDHLVLKIQQPSPE
jgi:hypothetical protein